MTALIRYILLLLFVLHSSTTVYAQSKYDSLYSIATTQFKNGNYATNLKLTTQVLQIAENAGDCNEICRATLKVAAAYYYVQQYPLSLTWMYKARTIAYRCNIDSFKWISARQIGAIYFESGKSDSSLLFLKEAEKLISKTNGNWAEKSYLYAILGELLYRQLNQKAEGKRRYDLAMEYALRSGDTIKMAFANVKMGSYHNSEGNCRLAVKHLQKAVDLYKSVHLTEGIMYGMYVLASAHSECGNAKITYIIMRDLKMMRDSVFRDETAKRTAEYRTLYETEKKEKENLSLQKNNALQKLQIADEVRMNQILIVSSIAGIIILIAVFLLIYNRYKHKKKAEFDERIAIQQKLRFKAVLEAEEKERVRIARELHDSLGQMLSAAKMNISAMDSYNEDDTKLVNNAKKLIDDSVKEVRTISHNLMPVSLMEKGIEPALNELANKINDTGLLHIDLIISTDEQRLDTSVEIAIYRIVQEVINNMIKHSKANRVEILLDYNTEKIHLSIKDNGVGFDTAQIETSTGIGWKNIFSRVYMMNGDVQIESQPGRGTLVNIEFAK